MSAPRIRPRRAARAALLTLLATAAACTDRNPAGPAPGDPGGPGGPGAPPLTIQSLVCKGNFATLSVTCAPPAPETGGTSPLIVGGQNVYVKVTTSNIVYNNGTGQFTFNTTLQNLLPQPMGTTDGTTLDPGGVRIFFSSGPTVTSGTGSVAVIPDGFATFTAGGQAYYQFSEILEQNETSAADTWTFIMPPTVGTFEFVVFISTPVPFPNGYISLDGQLPGYSYGPLHPADTEALTAVSHDAYGNVIAPTTVTFATTDPLCASVNTGTGLVTGVRFAACQITASDGTRNGSMTFSVTGTTRLWDGDVSADWQTDGNWAAGLVPATADSVSIPVGVPFFPALTQNVVIGGVEVADGATLTLGAFGLAANANVATGSTPGSGIVGGGAGVLSLAGTGTVRGRAPSLLVTGTYALSGDLFVVAPEQIDAGSLQNDAFEMQVVSQ